MANLRIVTGRCVAGPVCLRAHPTIPMMKSNNEANIGRIFCVDRSLNLDSAMQMRSLRLQEYEWMKLNSSGVVLAFKIADSILATRELAWEV